MKIIILTMSLWSILISTKSVAQADQCSDSQFSKIRTESKKLFDTHEIQKAIDKLKSKSDQCQADEKSSEQRIWMASDLVYYVLQQSPQVFDCIYLFKYAKVSDYSNNHFYSKKPKSRAGQALYSNYEKCQQNIIPTLKPISLIVDNAKISELPICKNKSKLFKLSMNKKDLKSSQFSLKSVQASESFESHPGEGVDAASMHWIGDLNADSVQDLILQTACSNTGAVCDFKIFLNCGQNRFVTLNDGVIDHSYGVEVVKDATLVDGMSWLNITVGQISPGPYISDDEIKVRDRSILSFDGKKYLESKANRKARDKKDLIYQNAEEAIDKQAR